MVLDQYEAENGHLTNFAIESVLVAESSPELLNLDSVLGSSLVDAWESEAIHQEITYTGQQALVEASELYGAFVQEDFQSRNRTLNNRSGKRASGDLDARFTSEVRRILTRVRLSAFQGDSMDNSRESLKASWIRMPIIDDPEKKKNYEAELDVYRHAIDHVYGDLGQSYVNYYYHRRASVKNIYDFLAEQPAEIPNFLAWIETQTNNDDQEQDPLLINLANDVHDRGGDKIAEDFWNRLRSGEVNLDFRREFINERLEQLTTDEVEPGTDLEILSFLKSVYGDENDELIEGIVHHFENWPQSFKDNYDAFHKSIISFAEQRLSVALEGRIRRSRFDPRANGLPPAMLGRGLTHETGRKRSGRVTPSISRLVDIESVEGTGETAGKPVFQGYGRVLQAERGLMFEECDRASILKILQSFSKRYGSSSEYLADMVRMLDSIFQAPFGQGASPMKQYGRVNLGNGKTNLVWHLNPNQRPNLDLNDQESARSRILYVAAKISQTRSLLGIVGVGHHNNIDKGRLK